MANSTADFGTEAKCCWSLLLPTSNCLSRGKGVENCVSLDCGQTSAVEVKEISCRCMLGEKIPYPLFITPHGTANIQHLAPFCFIVASYTIGNARPSICSKA